MLHTDVGISNYESKWFQATPEGEAALHAVIAGETVTCPVTRADDAGSESLLGTAPMWFTPPVVNTEPDTTGSEQSPNVSGSILLSNTNSVNGDLVIGASLLQDSSNVMIRLAGADQPRRWLDHLDIAHIAYDADGFAHYDWEAVFAQPGCYVLYAYMPYHETKVYLEMEQ